MVANKKNLIDYIKVAEKIDTNTMLDVLKDKYQSDVYFSILLLQVALYNVELSEKILRFVYARHLALLDREDSLN